MRKLISSGLAAVLLAAPFLGWTAEPESSGYTKLVVLFGPGGTSDVTARYVASKLTDALGKSVVIENRPGGNGTVGVMAVKNAQADGRTLLVASNTPLSVNPVTQKNLPYDPIKDFKPVIGLLRVQNVFVVASDSKIKTLANLVSAAKKDASNRMSVGTFSVGHQLTTEWFASMAGVKFLNVPYKGAGEILTNLIGHELDFASVDVPSALPLLAAGKIRALAVSGETRNASLPNVPTIGETYPGYASYSWIALYARSQTPAAVTQRLTQAVQKILASEEATAFALKVGGELMPMLPDAMQKMQHAELERFAEVAKAAGIQAQ